MKLQEQVYTKKLTNIRKILHHQDPGRYTMGEEDTQGPLAHPQSVGGASNSQLSRLERLQKLKQLNAWTDEQTSP